MGMIDRLRSVFAPQPAQERDMWPFVNFNGHTYPLSLTQTLMGKEEGPTPGYSGLVDWAYRTNAVVYACEQARVQLFAEAVFEWRSYDGRRFTDSRLGVLEKPWPNGVTADLLIVMLLDADLAGDSFTLAVGRDRLARLRPDWTTVVTDLDPWEPNAAVVGYGYQAGGPGGGQKPVLYDVSRVAHFKVSQDPLSPHRGMSWLTPVIREIAADIGMTEHKRAFLVNGATPNLVVSLDPTISKAAFDQWKAEFDKGHRGARNAYETLILGGGAKVEVVGKDLQQLDFKLVQGAGETRIAAAAGVPPVIVGLSEGLQAATYSNYSQARRRFADGTMRPLWRNASASLQTIVPNPGGASLVIDDGDIAFLQDDLKDRADIQSTNASAIGQLVKDGFTPESAVLAITTGDLTKLEHTHLYSVQLQPPMPDGPPEPTDMGPPDGSGDTTPDTPSPEDTQPARDEMWGRLFELSERRADAAERMAEREPPAPVINVTTPEQPVTVTIERGAVEVSAPVTIEPTVVNVTTPEVRNEITVEPTPVEITNEVSVEPTPVEITNEVSVEPTPLEVNVEPAAVSITNEIPEQRAVTKRVVRDERNLITEIIEEPTDGE
jgi:hypothetical protein